MELGSPMTFLVIDAGTWGVKASLFNARAEIVSRARQDWSYEIPEGLHPLSKEFDPRRFWKAVVSTSRKVLREGSSSRDRLKAIIVTSQRHGVVFLDQKGLEIYGGPNLDLRADLESSEIAADLGDRIYGLTGHWPGPQHLLPRLLWFKRHKPSFFDRIGRFMMISDWINYRLTGTVAGEASGLSETLLWEPGKRCFSTELIGRFQLPSQIFPEVVESGSVLGTLSRRAARQLGIPQSVRVVVGGGDTPCGLLGCGAAERGQAGVIAGTSAPVQGLIDNFIADENRNLSTSSFVLPGLCTLEGNTLRAGTVLAWFISQFLKPFRKTNDDRLYAFFEKEAAKISPGSGGLFSFLGPVVGGLKSFQRPVKSTILDVATLPPAQTSLFQLGRAILENIAFAIRGNLELMTELTQQRLRFLFVAGGLAKSRLFLRILGDVLDLPLKVPQIVETSSLGAFLLGAMASDQSLSEEDAVHQYVRISREIDPDPEARKVYEAIYGAWREKYQVLLKVDG
jgi:autoinducer-2 kinase